MAYQVKIAAIAPFGLVHVRADAHAGAVIESLLGFALPRAPGTSAGSGELLGLWLGPDEWLVRTGDGAEGALASRLREGVGEGFAAITVVSDAYAIFEIAGADAVRILAQGTGIDVDPRAFGAGRCARTRFAKMRALLHAAGDEAGDRGAADTGGAGGAGGAVRAYHLYVPRSYAHYAERWLERARG